MGSAAPTECPVGPAPELSSCQLQAGQRQGGSRAHKLLWGDGAGSVFHIPNPGQWGTDCPFLVPVLSKTKNCALEWLWEGIGGFPSRPQELALSSQLKPLPLQLQGHGCPAQRSETLVAEGKVASARNSALSWGQGEGARNLPNPSQSRSCAQPYSSGGTRTVEGQTPCAGGFPPRKTVSDGNLVLARGGGESQIQLGGVGGEGEGIL